MLEYEGLTPPQMREKFRQLFTTLPHLNQTYLFHNVRHNALEDDEKSTTTEDEVASFAAVLRNQVQLNASRQREIAEIRIARERAMLHECEPQERERERGE